MSDDRKGTRHDITACMGCKYLATEYKWCNYGDVVGQSRLSLGVKLLPTGGCALKDDGEKVRRKIDMPRYGYKREKTYTEKRYEAQSKTMFALYQLGYSDRQIGNEIGKAPGTVQAWRKRRCLPPNYEPGSGKKILRGKDNG